MYTEKVIDPSIIRRHMDYDRMREVLYGSKTKPELFQNIVNTPFIDKLTAAFLGLGIVVLLINNKETGMIDRVALSNTEHAEGSKQRSAKKFEDIKIPANEPENIIAQVVRTGKHRQTDDWQYLFVPELTLEEARMNQASAGIACSIVYPLTANDGGALIFSYFISLEEISEEHHLFMAEYAKLASEKLAAN